MTNTNLLNFDTDASTYARNGVIKATVAKQFNLLDDTNLNVGLYNLFSRFTEYEYPVDKIKQFLDFMGCDYSVDYIQKALAIAVRRGALYSVMRSVGKSGGSCHDTHRVRFYGVLLAS